MWFLFGFVLPMCLYPRKTEHHLLNLCTGNLCAGSVFYSLFSVGFGYGMAGLPVQFPSNVQRYFIKVIMISTHDRVEQSKPRQGCTHLCLPL